MCREQKSVSDFCISFAYPKHVDPRVGFSVPRWLEHVIRCGVKQTMLKPLLVKVISDQKLLHRKSPQVRPNQAEPQKEMSSYNTRRIQKVFQMRLLGAFGKVRLFFLGGLSSTLLSQSLDFTPVQPPNHCFPTSLLSDCRSDSDPNPIHQPFLLDLHWVSFYPLY